MRNHGERQLRGGEAESGTRECPSDRAAQAKKEKTAKIILYSGIGVVVVAVAVIVTLLVVQSARPANPPANYVAGGVSSPRAEPWSSR